MNNDIAYTLGQVFGVLLFGTIGIVIVTALVTSVAKRVWHSAPSRPTAMTTARVQRALGLVMFALALGVLVTVFVVAY